MKTRNPYGKVYMYILYTYVYFYIYTLYIYIYIYIYIYTHNYPTKETLAQKRILYYFVFSPKTANIIKKYKWFCYRAKNKLLPSYFVQMHLTIAQKQNF